MKIFKLILALCTLYHLSNAQAFNPCPKYWKPQISSSKDIEAEKLEKVSLKEAADLVLEPGFRADLVKDNNDCGQLAWYETRRLEGYLDMYLSTKDRDYLRKFVETADRLFEVNDIFTRKKDDLRKRIVYGWSSIKYTTRGQRHVHGVQSGIFSEMYARFSRTVWENKVSEFYEKAQDYYVIAQETLNEVMEDWDPKIKFFRFIPGAHDKYSVYPYNQGLAIGSAYLELYKIALIKNNEEEVNRIKDVILPIGQYFKNVLELDTSKERYLWRYAPGAYYEDMSHAGLDLNFVMKAYENNLLFDKKDMKRFANTIKHAYLPRDGEYGRYIDGKQLPGYTNWYSMTCLLLVDYSQFDSSDSILNTCEESVDKIIYNKNVLKKMDAQFFGLLSNGLPKLYKMKK